MHAVLKERLDEGGAGAGERPTSVGIALNQTMCLQDDHLTPAPAGLPPELARQPFGPSVTEFHQKSEQHAGITAARKDLVRFGGRGAWRGEGDDGASVEIVFELEVATFVAYEPRRKRQAASGAANDLALNG